jgi:uncharacterized delta-60 repeat protein
MKPNLKSMLNLLAMLWAACSFPVHAAPGDVDASFNSAIPLDSSTRYISSPGPVVVTQGGKILVGTIFPDGRVPHQRGIDFSSQGGVNTNALVRLNLDGTIDPSLKPLIMSRSSPYFVENIYGHVMSIVQQPDRKILIGGDFDTVNGTPRDRIARLEPDGSLDAAFNPVTGLTDDNWEWRSMALQPDGKIVVCGDGRYNSFVGAPPAIIRFHPDGTLDDSFSPQVEGDWAAALLLQPDGKILVAGSFTRINGVPRRSAARLNPDGTLDHSFANVQVAFRPPGFWEVKCLALQPNGKVLLGGFFTSVNGISRQGIARLNTDGTLDRTFDAGLMLDWNWYQAVRAIAPQPDGKVIIGGNFHRVGGIALTNVARLNSDGTVDTAFAPKDAAYYDNNFGGVESLALQPGGNILLARSLGPMVRLHSSDVLPALRVARIADEVILTWPVAGSAGAVLESADPAAGTLIWTREAASPSTVGDQHLLSIEPVAPTRIYRLRGQ